MCWHGSAETSIELCVCSITSAITAMCLTSNCPSVLYQHTAWLLQIRNVTFSLFNSVWYPSQSSLYNYIFRFNRQNFSLAISPPLCCLYFPFSLSLSLSKWLFPSSVTLVECYRALGPVIIQKMNGWVLSSLYLEKAVGKPLQLHITQRGIIISLPPFCHLLMFSRW